MKATVSTNVNGVWSQLLCWLDLRTEKRPTSVVDAQILAKAVAVKWRSEGRRPLVAAHRNRSNIINELMRLRQTGGTDHEMACVFVSKIGRYAGKNLRMHDLFDELYRQMSKAVAAKVAKAA